MPAVSHLLGGMLSMEIPRTDASVRTFFGSPSHDDASCEGTAHSITATTMRPHNRCGVHTRTKAHSGFQSTTGTDGAPGGMLNGVTTWMAEGSDGPSSGSALWARMMIWQARRMS
ncbi:hypothetical protein SAMN02787118_114104 [Streptomyces mirabilis]|uniref:Uncharacterized protein n=1 Tax=Streptomyces mirabilis TaxID=68239 RepID=A0A1I2N668_9ACTN|nr:hypothetical protein SAMN02787118_114104 [Streptomyces mirabilis]